MKTFTIHKNEPDEILKILKADSPELEIVIAKNEKIKLPFKGSVLPYQAALIYTLAKQYNGGNILEIGLGRGYSTSYLAMACPDSRIDTISISEDELISASINLKRNGYKNIGYHLTTSTEYYRSNKKFYDLIFVDGDHKHVRDDLPFWNRLNNGGLFLFHDYCEVTQPVVWSVLNVFADKHPMEIEVIDSNGIGMAGFYKPLDYDRFDVV